MAGIRTISPLLLKELYERNPAIVVLDVRTPAEFQSVKASFAKLASLESLDPRRAIHEAVVSGADAIYLFCGSGTRARLAGEGFLKEGYDNIFVVEGGIAAWEAAGLPVLRGRKVISLERQVRIAAGSLVLLGLILGFAVNLAFIGVTAFVGCGLVFAGITDTCGMGLLLAQMPWNRAGNDTPKACLQ